MKTLITTGCSYTSYAYDTWATYLGKSYDSHFNFGRAGSGPRYSHTTICDYLRFNYNKDYEYTFIIQWSSLLRVDYRTKNKGTLGSDGVYWSAGGQVNNNGNFDNNYIKKYFNVIDTASDLLQYIEHLILLSKHYNFKLYMLYMFEPWIENFFGEPCHVGSLIKQYKEFSNSRYCNELKNIYDTEYFIRPSIEKFCLENEERDFNIDFHPTTNQHKNYADIILKEYLS